MEQFLTDLIDEVKYELFHYPVTTKKQDLKYVVKRIVKPKDTPKRDKFFWTHALLTQALESAGEVDILKQYYDAWIGKGLPIYNIDNIMNGYSLLYVYEKTKDNKYKQAADRLYEYLCDYVKKMGNPMPYRKNHPTHVYVDGLGMVVPFLCRYGSMFQNKEALELGIRQIEAFFKYGMDEKSGLCYHGYDTKSHIKQGIIGWGRAVGWLMLAMADSMEYLPEGKEKEEMFVAFQELTEAVLKFQRKDGYFSWQLLAIEGPKDTSATAMIGYAIKKVYLNEKSKTACWCTGEKEMSSKLGLSSEKCGIEEETKNKVEAALKQIEKALFNSYKEGNIYDCSGECEGFSQYPQVYGAYPWSLGPAVRFFLY